MLDPRDSKITISIAFFSRRDFLGNLFPRTRCIEALRILEKVPANGHGRLDEDTFVQRKADETLGANECASLIAIPGDFCAAGKIQKITGFKIDEQQSRHWIDSDIADRIEMVVAGEIRKRQRIATFDPHEAQLAAPVGYVCTVTGVAGILGKVRFASYYVDEELANGDLVSVLEDYEVQDAATWIIYADRHHLPTRVRFLIDFLAERLGSDSKDCQPAKAQSAEINSLAVAMCCKILRRFSRA
jgi:hypothetical protein